MGGRARAGRRAAHRPPGRLLPAGRLGRRRRRRAAARARGRAAAPTPAPTRSSSTPRRRWPSCSCSEAANRCADRCRAGVRRPRLHAHERRRALLARAARRPHLGGHERDPAAHRRARARAPRRRARAALDGPDRALLAPARSRSSAPPSGRASYGGEALLNLRRLGFAGAVRGVNPRRAAVHGVRACRRWRTCPEAPDAVVVADPGGGRARGRRARPGRSAAAARSCSPRVRGGAGDGTALQAALARPPRRTTCPCAGPTATASSRCTPRAPLWGDMVAPARPGASRSSPRAATSPSTRWRSRRGLRLHTVVSCGNQAVARRRATTLEALAALDGVRSIALYLEADGDGARWCAALERCARAGVGVAVLKAGASGRGRGGRRARTPARWPATSRVFRAFMRGGRRGLGDATRTSCSSWPRRSRTAAAAAPVPGRALRS